MWDLVKLPPGRKMVGSKWVFKKKTGADGKVERYKARLVAQGFTQKYGMDYDETFCQTRVSAYAHCTICETKLQVASQVDVTTAFLNGSLEEEVYMRPKGKEHLVCKLKKSIYGLKQSPRCWNVALDAQLSVMGFSQSKNDPCIYFKDNKLYLGVYVDDIILAGKTDSALSEVKTALSRKFDIKDLSNLKVERRADDSIWIGQPLYTENLLGMQDCQHTWLQTHTVHRPSPVPICYWKLDVPFCKYSPRYILIKANH